MLTPPLILVASLLGARGEVDFGREVWPVLEARCISCHGPERARAGLRLDGRAGMFAGSRFGTRPILRPGDAGASRLWLRVSSTDADERMPPEGAPLSAAEVDRIAAWIDAGAAWPDGVGTEAGPARHWAYAPPAAPELPTPSAWARGPLDAFVERRLRAQGLEPSPEADRATLIRRVSLDLVGLPPTVAEVEAFERDSAPGAYERLVDRLLASPAYGEHLAAWWLDLARYADSHGYEKDARRVMWPWRDWVIDAFRRDLPLDRFTVEQLAGDLLPDAGVAEVVATGFHRNTMLNEEGGTDPEEFRVAAVVDRVNTTARVWLGSTLACAQCHDHKFDPFTQEDYYSLLAFFDSTEDVGNSVEPTVAAPSRAQLEREPAVRAELERLHAQLTTRTAALDESLAAWEAGARATLRAWRPLRPTRAVAEASRLAVLNDGSVLAVGDVPETERYTLELPLPAGRLAALRLEVLTDESLPGGGPGRTGHANFVLNELRVSLRFFDGVAARPLALERAVADFSQRQPVPWPAEAVVDGDPATGWAIAGGEGRAHQLQLALAVPEDLPEGARLVVELDQDYGGGHVLGRVRLSVAEEPPASAEPLVAPAIERLVARAAERTPEEDERLAAWWRGRAPSLDAARARVAELEAALRYPRAMVLRELAEPRTTHVLGKGSFLSPLEPVEPGFPAFLGGGDAPAHPGRLTRLDLARWLVSSANPLTARVMANRLWERVFGTGLVATLDDFGTQGEAPSHPELLDWLALRLVEDGWSVRTFLRRLVTSATYRQSAAARPADLALDPRDVWLARFPRRRVAAETLRDIALAASGLLVPEVGGPSVFPPQPEGTWAMTYSSERWETASGPERYRRGLYTFWRRTAPYPTYQLFDAPTRELSCTRRERSNTPLQALALMNDPVFVELALGLAHRALVEGGPDDEARLRFAFRACIARAPEAAELSGLLEFLARERARFASDPAAAQAFLRHAPRALALDDALDPATYAAWGLLAGVLLNLDETVTRG